jgi:hypothetical protein
MSELSAMLRAENKSEKFLETFKSNKNFDNLNDLSLDELRELNAMVIETINKKRNSKSTDIKKGLSIGDLVTVNSKKSKGDIFEIIKLNPKKAVIKNDAGFTFNCDYSLIETK